MGVSQNKGYLVGGVPHNKDHNMLGSILGSPCFWKLPYTITLKTFRYEGMIKSCRDVWGASKVRFKVQAFKAA